MHHKFLLVFQLPDKHEDSRVHTDMLTRNGINDAEVCWGIRGHLGLEFYRQAKSLGDAKALAIHQVKIAIPGVTLMLSDD